MGGIKVWLEGFGPRPTWVGDDPETGAAIHVDRAFASRVRGFLTKMFSCIQKPSTVGESTAETVPDAPTSTHGTAP